jgi:hypothetical protein
MNLLPERILDNWAVVSSEINPYTPPECIKLFLIGNCENIQVSIDTTDIKDFINENIIMEKVQYKLGTIDSEYEKVEKNARERTIKTLTDRFKKTKTEYETITVPKFCIPKNAKLVEAYENENEIIVIGDIDSKDENHNCDQMGCSSLNHVKYRFKKGVL